MKSNEINIPSHCKNVNYCTLIKVPRHMCFKCYNTNFNKPRSYNHQLCKEHVFEELTKQPGFF
jgi:hypothetical protein